MINNKTKKLIEHKFVNSIRNDVDLTLSDDNESNNALIRLPFADAIRLGGLSSVIFPPKVSGSSQYKSANVVHCELYRFGRSISDN